MQPNPRFWTKIAGKYAARPINDMAAYDQTLSRIRAHLPSDARVLEIGCGTGGTALRLAADVKTYLATDFSEGMIDQAHLRDAPDNVEFRVADVFDPAFEEGSFDAIIALNLLHLLDDMPTVYARLRKLLKPEGVFVSKTPCIGEGDLGFKFGLLKRAIPIMQWLGKAPFVRFLSRDDMDHEITTAGFRIVETGNYPVRPPNHFVVAHPA